MKRHLLLVMIFMILFCVPSMSVSEIQLYAGQSMQLTAELVGGDESDESIKWTTDNPQKVTVSSSGVITAKEVGSTMVRATYSAGTHIQDVAVEIQVKPTVKELKTDKDTLSLTTGGKEQITVEVVPVENLSATLNSGVSYKTTDASIAVVNDSGEVSAIKPGLAYIIVSSIESGHSKSVKVDVASVVEGIAFDVEEIKIGIGETMIPSVAFDPVTSAYTGYELESLNTDIATTNGNAVKGKNEGTTWIRVVSIDGSFKDALKITVESLIENIVIPEKKIYLTDGKLTEEVRYDLKWKTTEEPHEKGVSWISSNPDIASVNSTGYVTGKKNGLARITAITTDGKHQDYTIAEVDIREDAQPQKTYPRSIVMGELPTSVFVGEEVTINYVLTPDYISEDAVRATFPGSNKTSISNIPNNHTVSFDKEGVQQVHLSTENNKSDEKVVIVKSAVEGIDIDTSYFEDDFGWNIVYLGQEATIEYLLEKDPSAPQIYERDVVFTTNNGSGLELLDKNKGTFLIKESSGPQIITVTTEDGGHSDSIQFRIAPTVKSISVPNQVTTGVNLPYSPPVVFEYETDLRYGLLEALVKDVKLEIEKSFVTRDFIEVELAYEKKNADEIRERKSKAEDTSTYTRQLQESLSRQFVLESLIESNSGEYIELRKSGAELLGRDGEKLVPFQIDKGKITGQFVGKAVMKVTSLDGDREDRMTVFFEDDVKTLTVYDDRGTLVGTSDGEVLEEIKAAQEQAKLEREIELHEAFLEEYRRRGETSVPSEWAIPFLYRARSYGLLTQRIDQNFQEPISRELFAELVVLTYSELTDQQLTPVPFNYFLDTENQAVLQAYQLGIVSGTGNRTYSPTRNVVREEIAVMLNKLILVSDKMDDSLIPTKDITSFSDFGTISEWSKESLMLLNGSIDVVGGYPDGRLGPRDSTTVEQAITMCVKVLERLK